MSRSLLALCAALAVASAPAASWAKAPRLTLVITIDSGGTDVFQRARPNFKSGLAQAISQGAYFPHVRYPYAETVTAAGHATLATGASPWRHGVVSNHIINRGTGKAEAIFYDPDHPPLGAPAGLNDSSPANLEAETLADRLRLSTYAHGKAISISGKARASIALAGRLGTAWWFDEETGQFVTGTWYAKEFPAWVKALNEKRPADALFAKQWTPLLPTKALAGEDDRSWETDLYALGRTFPHSVTGGLSAPGRQFYAALASTPLMDDLLVQMAKAAIDGEGLGKDDVPDLLAVSFSPIDRIYHLYGPYSWEVQDALARLDRNVGELIAAAEKAAGKGNVLVAITADHGGAALPEEWLAAGLPAARVSPARLQAGLNEELKKRFGSALCVGIEEVDVYLDDPAIAEKKLDGAAVRRAAAQWLAAQPDIAFAVARDDLYQADGLRGYLPALQRGYFPRRSGDVLMIAREYHVVSDHPTGTSHGTPYAYDALVPLVLYGRNVRPGLYQQEIHATDIAPTVAALMELAPPAMSEGVPRAEAMNGAK
ncbi:MAG: alkaline phosphatase family protein [Myxococcaceae bacterium]|nr:alkaline phosphatase family protein [Myxococcaceae bacterium]